MTPVKKRMILRYRDFRMDCTIARGQPAAYRFRDHVHRTAAERPAAAVLAAIPTVLLYLIFQRRVARAWP